jgi:hypothetical protein
MEAVTPSKPEVGATSPRTSLRRPRAGKASELGALPSPLDGHLPRPPLVGSVAWPAAARLAATEQRPQALRTLAGRALLARSGAAPAEIDFLMHCRVGLNAVTSDELLQ